MEPLSEHTNAQLEEAAQTGKKLFEAAVRETQQEAPRPRTVPSPQPITENDRLNALRSATNKSIDSFQDYDTTDNHFLGRHELEAMKEKVPLSNIFLKNYQQITNLRDDFLQTYGADSCCTQRVPQNHLGISRNDLATLQKVLDNDDYTMNQLALERSCFSTSNYATAAVAALAGTFAFYGKASGLLSGRTAVLTAVAGLIPFSISHEAGRIEERKKLDEFRSSLLNDSSIDAVIMRQRSTFLPGPR